MSTAPDLLPRPRRLRLTGGVLSLAGTGAIVVEWPAAPVPDAVLARARAVLAWPLATTAGDGPVLRLRHAVQPHGDEAYRLRLVRPGEVIIEAGSPVGLAYGLATLAQVLAQRGLRPPALEIDDWPDFARRGVMLDISRDKVPTMATLYALIDRLASWKINELQLYTEHTFAYPGHEVVWRDADPLTAEEVRALDAFCAERFIDLVPNQNSFGHMHRWLKHPAYRHLAECPDGCDTEWGHFDGPFSLAPGPDSLTLLDALYADLLPNFRSGWFNVGCDETVDLGQGRNRERVAEVGVGRVYLDFVLEIHKRVAQHGRRMMLWGDVILKHPELVPELPDDVMALDWGYEADHPFGDEAARFRASGVPFYLVPGTSSWNSVAGRPANARANLRSAALQARRHGAAGLLITDWGDAGHWQPLPVSYPPLVYGAALAWAVDANLALDINRLADRFAFDAPASGRGGGDTVSDCIEWLGTAHEPLGIAVHNGTVLFRALQNRPAAIARWPETGRTGEAMQTVVHDWPDEDASLAEQLVMVADGLDGLQVPRNDPELVYVQRMLAHAARRLHWARGYGGDPAALRREADTLIYEHFEPVWRLRNREGGLADSRARLERMRDDYPDS